jgi:hypothetical protein
LAVRKLQLFESMGVEEAIKNIEQIEDGKV